MTNRSALPETGSGTNDHYKFLIENLNDTIYTTDHSGIITYISPPIEKTIGYAPSEIIGRPFTAFIDRSDRDKIISAYEQLKSYTPQSSAPEKVHALPIKKCRIVDKYGSAVWVRTSSQPIFENGKFIGLQGVLTDISHLVRTDIQESQHSLKKRDSQYKGMFNDHHAIMMLIDPKSVDIVDVNQAACRYYGYTKEELTSMKMDEINIIPIEELQIEKKTTPLMNRRYFQSKHRLKSGELRDVEVYSGPVRIGDEDYLYSIIHDITIRKKTQKALNESRQRLQKNEELFRTIIESTSDCILVWDKSYNYLYANQSAINHVGTTRDKVIGKNMVDGLGHIPDFMLLWMRRVDNVFEKGDILRVEDAVPIGGRMTYSESVLSPLRDENGDIFAVSVVYRDITEKKQDEDQIKKALQEKELFLSEIHHRVKNNLAVIISLLNLQANRTKDPAIGEILKDSRDRIMAMSLIHDTLYRKDDFSRIHLEEYTRMLSNHLTQVMTKEHSQIDIIFEMDDIRLNLDQAIPCGLILNELLTNALKYAFPEGRGRIIISAHRTTTNHIELTVHDNGIGLPESNLSHPDSLGLNIVSILTENQLDGTLEIRNKKGAYFSIQWPDGSSKRKDNRYDYSQNNDC